MRFRCINLPSLLFVLFFVFVAANSVNNVTAQNSAGKWSYFKFKAGQYFKYELRSDRGMPRSWQPWGRSPIPPGSWFPR